MTRSRENVLMQLGDYCNHHLCKNCPIGKIANEHHHRCPEVLKIPEAANKISEILKHRRTRKCFDGLQQPAEEVPNAEM